MSFLKDLEQDSFWIALFMLAVVYWVGFSTDAAVLFGGAGNFFNTLTGRNAQGNFANYPGQSKGGIGDGDFAGAYAGSRGGVPDVPGSGISWQLAA